MNVGAPCWTSLLAICLLSFGCQRQAVKKEAPPFRIVATDAGFEAPERLAAGLRHMVVENRGSEIHEGMLVKLPKGMDADDYVTAVKKGSLFPEGALDYSGPGLTSPGVTAEIWLRVDPGSTSSFAGIKVTTRRRRFTALPSTKSQQPMIARQKKTWCSNCLIIDSSSTTRCARGSK
jgi:hypothetical protein